MGRSKMGMIRARRIGVAPALDFEVVRGVSGDRIGTDQQQNNIGGVELLVDDLGAIAAGKNVLTAPAHDDALAFELGQESFSLATLEQVPEELSRKQFSLKLLLLDRQHQNNRL